MGGSRKAFRGAAIRGNGAGWRSGGCGRLRGRARGATACRCPSTDGEGGRRSLSTVGFGQTDPAPVQTPRETAAHALGRHGPTSCEASLCQLVAGSRPSRPRAGGCRLGSQGWRSVQARQRRRTQALARMRMAWGWSQPRPRARARARSTAAPRARSTAAPRARASAAQGLAWRGGVREAGQRRPQAFVAGPAPADAAGPAALVGLPLWWGCRSGGVERREAFDGRRRPRRRAGRRSGSVRGHRRAPRGRGQGEPWSAIGPPLVRGRWRAASPGSPLADTARWGPAGLRRVGADRHDHQARLHQVIDQEARRPPDRHRRRAVTPQPSGRRRQPLAVVADLEPLQRRALGVEHAGRVGAAAPVDAREPLLHGPPPPIWSKAPSAGSPGGMLVARRSGGLPTAHLRGARLGRPAAVAPLVSQGPSRGERRWRARRQRGTNAGQDHRLSPRQAQVPDERRAVGRGGAAAARWALEAEGWPAAP